MKSFKILLSFKSRLQSAQHLVETLFDDYVFPTFPSTTPPPLQVIKGRQYMPSSLILAMPHRLDEIVFIEYLWVLKLLITSSGIWMMSLPRCFHGGLGAFNFFFWHPTLVNGCPLRSTKVQVIHFCHESLTSFARIAYGRSRG